MSDMVYTSDRKEAYEYAKLLSVVYGVKDVFVSAREEVSEFQVMFDIDKTASAISEHELYIELATLLKEYDLQGFNCIGKKWEDAFKVVRTEEN